MPVLVSAGAAIAAQHQVADHQASRFGRGYGEENDFSMRAAGAGWRNVLAGDVFVYHEGAVSFSDERVALTAISVTPCWSRLNTVWRKLGAVAL